ncbi:MAG: peptidoglycan-binding protein [Planctomycetota bacterium]
MRECPACGGAKASWTMFAEETRSFRVTGKKVELKRGERDEPLSPDDPRQRGVQVVDAREVVALTKEDARDLHARGLLPAPRDLLFVRLYPRNHRDLNVGLELLFEQAEVGEVVLELERPADLSADGCLDVAVLFVYGPGEPPPAPPGLHVVDLSEEGATGHAPTVSVRALKKPAQSLPVRARAAQRVVEVVALDPSGAPLADRPWTLRWEGGEMSGTTDEHGGLAAELPEQVVHAELEVGAYRFPLEVDALDPVEEQSAGAGVTGCQARLHNLGYDPGPADGEAGPRTREAVKGFQAACGLSVTGELDAATRQRLVEAHGC